MMGTEVSMGFDDGDGDSRRTEFDEIESNGVGKGRISTNSDSRRVFRAGSSVTVVTSHR